MTGSLEILDLRNACGAGADAAARALCAARDAGARAVLVAAAIPAEPGAALPLCGSGGAVPARPLVVDEALALLGRETVLAAMLVEAGGGGSARADAILRTLERAGSPAEVVVLDEDPETLSRIKARAPLLATGLVTAAERLQAAVEQALGCAATVLLADGPPRDEAAVTAAEDRGVLVWSRTPGEEERLRGRMARDSGETGRARPAEAGDDAPRLLVLDGDDERVVCALLHPARGLERVWSRLLRPRMPAEGDGSRRDAIAQLLEQAAESSPRVPAAAALVLPSPPPGEPGSALEAAEAFAELSGAPAARDPSTPPVPGLEGLAERATVGDHGRVAWGAKARVPVRVLTSSLAAALVGAAGPEGNRLLVYLERRAHVLRGRPAPGSDAGSDALTNAPLWTAEGKGPGRVHLLRETVSLPVAARGGMEDPRDDRARALARSLALGDPPLEPSLDSVGAAARKLAGPRDRTILLAAEGSRVPQLPRRLRDVLPLEPVLAVDAADPAWIGAGRLTAAAARVPWSFRLEVQSLR
jgi:hypothetical protein